MSKWGMVRLEDVCEILDYMRVPVTASARKSGIYPYYGANGIQDYVSDYIFDDELVLLAEDGGNFGSKTKPIAYRASGKCWVNNHAHVLKAKPSIDIDYLCYSIMFYDVSKIISGTTRAKLNQAAMRKMIIPLPPLKTQKQIAKTLDMAADLLAMRKQQLAELDNLIISVFFDMFGDPETNNKGWNTCTAGDLILVLTDYHSNGSYENLRDNVLLLNKPDYALMIRTIDLENKNYINDVKYITKEAYEYLEKSKVFGGEIIINKIGSAGKVYLMPYLNRPVSLAMNQFLLRFNDSTNVMYVYCYLKTEFSEKNISDRVRGAVTKTITKEAVRSIPFRLPPIELQNKFAEIVTKIEEQKALVQKAIDETQYLFDSLMSEYFDD
ncbi:MAG: restriction modification system dna specificity domain [Firmicutes bacterium]|nr:restriction modification system dna specificity domain [Bacillota bacterium]